MKYSMPKVVYGCKYKLDPNVDLKTQCEGGLAHQKRFHFWEYDPTVETDKLVDAIWDDFTMGKRHVKITGVNRSEHTISIEFDKKMCYRFGIHEVGGYTLELMKKRDIDVRLQEKRSIQKNVRQSKWSSFQRGNL